MKMLFQVSFYLFLGIHFGKLSCSRDIPICKKIINLNVGHKCNFIQNLFQSEIHIYGDSSFNKNLNDSIIHPRKRTKKLNSRLSYIYLNAYPVLLTRNLRYKANFCIEVLSKSLLESHSILLKFSTRKRSDEDKVYEFEVYHQILMVNDGGDKEYTNIGCYWHNIIFLATCELTIELEVALLTADMYETNAKFYFRLPDWEQLSGQENVNPSFFAPFVYVAETNDTNLDKIIIRGTNCSKSFVEIEQRKESSEEELIQKKLFYIKDFKMNNINFEVTNAPLHFYRAILKCKEPYVGSMEAILIPVLTLLTLTVIVTLWYIKLNILIPKNAIMFLKRKPRVMFQFCKSSCFETYQKQTEILILYMENFCNIVVVNCSGKSKGTFKSAPLPEEAFDVIVQVPFPLTEDKCDFEKCVIKRGPFELFKKDQIILELPFWSTSSTPFEELYQENKNWKYFKLMDEFIPFIRYVNRRRFFIQRQYVSNLDTEQMQQKLEECNLTNEGFKFCLEQACTSNKFIDKGSSSSFETESDALWNLHEMEI